MLVEVGAHASCTTFTIIENRSQLYIKWCFCKVQDKDRVTLFVKEYSLLFAVELLPFKDYPKQQVKVPLAFTYWHILWYANGICRLSFCSI